MKRANTQKRTTSLGARLLSLLLAACMVAGLGWTAAGTAYAVDEQNIELTETTESEQKQETGSGEVTENKDTTQSGEQDPAGSENAQQDPADVSQVNTPDPEDGTSSDDGTIDTGSVTTGVVPEEENGQESGDGEPMAIDDDTGDDETGTAPQTQPVTYVPVIAEIPGQVKLTGDGFTEQRFSFGLRLDEETHTVQNEDGTTTDVSVEQNGVGFIRVAGITGATVKEADTYENFTFYEKYTEPGSYKYSMYPVSYTNNAVEYDHHTFQVTVQVTADADGKLTYALQDMVGSNRFDHALKSTGDTEPPKTEPASTTATIQGYKVLKGRDMIADEFQIGLELMQSPDVDVNGPKADIDAPAPDSGGYTEEVDDEQGTENTILQSTAATEAPSKDLTQSVAAGTDGQAVPVSFPMTYTLAGTYIYKMYEVDTGVAGIIYDTHECRVQVVVTLNDDGTLTASAPEYVGSSTFTNRVASEDSVTVSIGGYKVLEGRDMRENEEFTFGLKPLSAQPGTTGQTETTKDDSALESGMQNLTIHTKSTSGYAGGLSSSAVVTTTVKGAKNGTPKAFAFDDITYFAPGVYTYSMYEIPGSDENMTYDDAAYTVVVTVTKTEAGTLAADVEYLDANNVAWREVHFVNQFKGLTLTFGGKKTLIGRNMTQGEFTFVLDSNPNNPATYWAGEDFDLVDAIDTSSSVQTLQRARALSAGSGLEQFRYTMVGNPAAADGQQAAFTFPELTFTEPGTYEFAMLEIGRNDENVTYDTHECFITVTVNSDFTYSVSYNGSTSFVNQYQEPGTDGPVATAVITGTKTLFGRNMADGETFDFTLTPDFKLDEYGVSVVDETEDQDAHYNNFPTTKARAKAPASTGEGTISTTVLNASVSGAKNGQPVAVPFGALRFTQKGTYIFEMAETKGDAEDIAYDSHTCKVYVEVTEDTDTGRLHAEVHYVGDNNFKNYSLSDATVTLTGTKTLIGRDMIDGEFQFKLSEVSRSALDNNLSTTKPIDLDDTETDTDSAKYLGTAAAPAAASGETVPFGFEPITYTEPGIYRYTIEENKGMDDVEYDERVYSVEVRVVAGDNGLEVASVTYKDQAGNASEQADFVNYAGVYVELTAEKRLNGRDMENYEFQFNLTYTGFTRTKAVVVKKIEDRDGKLISESSNVLPQGIEETYPKLVRGYSTAAKAGTFSDISFDWAPFTEPGIYYYILSEVPGNDPSITYDTTEYAVVINVTESDTEGMKNTVQYYKITGDEGSTMEPCEKPSFTNVAQTVKTDLTCTKKLLGRDMENGEFSFGLYLISEPSHYNNLPTSKAIDLDQDHSYVSIAEVGEGADGVAVPFTFKDVTLNRVGTYVFGVEELYNYDPTVCYDTHEGIIKVTVGKDKDNKLTVTDIQYDKKDFVNMVGANVALQASKTMVGRDMTEGEFSFTVTPPKSYTNVTAMTENLQQRTELNAKNQKNHVAETIAAIMRDSKSELKGPLSATGTAYAGSTVQGPAAKADTKTVFNLETLTFTKPGTYKFTIQETTGQETGVRYDTNTWTATVVVAKGDGGMTATVSYTDSQGNTSTQADFVNSVNTTPGTPYTPVKPTEPEETKKPTEPDVPTTVDDHPEDDKPQEPTVTEGPTQPEGPTITVGPEDSLEDGNEGTGLDKPQEEQPNETAPETSVKPSVAPQTASSTSLPQTGQDWWPVLLLAAVGVLLIAAGVFHGKKHNI